MSKILVLSTENPAELKQLLEEDGHTVIQAGNAKKVQTLLKDDKGIRLLIVSIRNDEFDDLYKILDGKERNLPVLVLVPSLTLPGIIFSLDRGATDVMKSPAHPQVLKAKVRALIRTQTRREENGILRIGDIALDTKKFRASLEGNELRLTAATFKLLQQFMQAPDQVFSRSALMLNISHEVDTDSRTVDTMIALLRKALEHEGDRIVTKRGEGYYFRSR